MGDCLLLFPKELWEMILDRVEDSKDVLQVFKVFPELDLSFKNKKRVWLVGQVIRILMNRYDLEEKDVLKCRLVCKQWKIRVDCALETQSVLQAYHMERDKEEKDHWEAIDHWNMIDNLEKLDDYMQISSFHAKKFFGGVVFNSALTDVSEFLDYFESCPSTQHPFVGRILTVIFAVNEETPEDVPPNDDRGRIFWSDCFRVLEKYGQHIWHLNVLLDDLTSAVFHEIEMNPPLGIWNTIFQVLAHLPNLKSIQLGSCNSSDTEFLLQPNSSELRPQPPSLPNLESLSILRSFPDELINPILTSFGSQLRKLELPVGLWNKGMNDLFKNLTELEVDFGEHCHPSGEEIPILHTPSGLIPSLVAPHLVMLRAKNCHGTDIKIESKVFEWLRRFPVLKYLNIGEGQTNMELHEENLNSKDEAEIEKFPSVEYLFIYDSGKLSFNFLRSFPSLREIKMFINDEPLVTDLSIPNSQIKLREQLQTLQIYNSNIWEHLPKLMSVILYETDAYVDFVLNLKETYKFSREGYEKSRLARRNEDEDNQNEFSELRKYIQRYLKISDDVSDCESSDASTIGSLDDDFDLDGIFG